MDEDQQSGIVTCENGHEQQKQQQHATAAAVVGPNYLVLIRMPSGNEKFVTIEPGTTISLGKFGSFKSDHLIGKPLGSSFEIHGAALSPYLVPFTPATFDDATDETTNNNQYIFNDNHAQKLDSDQIEAMKQAGLSGSVTTEEIIESIKSNNEAFDKKTEYSKSKYLKRKENKFRKMFTVLEPTTFNITEHMFKKNPERIRYLRIDTLSQILTLANVCQSSKVLMIDETQGLILSSVLRIIQSPSGGGVVYALHDGQDPVLNMTKFFNFDHTVFGQLVTTLSIKYVGKPLEPFAEEWSDSFTENQAKSFKRRQTRHQRINDLLGRLKSTKFDSLIISTKYDSGSVVRLLEGFLGPSRVIVVHSPNKESLLTAYEYLRTSPKFINVNISESWLRQYQVLPNRTHPLMSMSSEGGFILSAIKVLHS